MMKLFGISRRD